jgi:dGTPase
MSSNYLRVCREAIEQHHHPPLYSKVQLIIDYVCGMTDLFAVNLHKELLGA